MLVCPWQAGRNHTKEAGKFIITLISHSFLDEQTAYLAWLGKKIRPWEKAFMIASNY